MKRIKNIIAISVFSMVVLALPSIASAQWGGNNRGYDPNGRYGQRPYYGNLESVAKRLKDRSRDFERQVDRDSNYNRNRNVGILGTIFGGNPGYNSYQLKRLAEDFRKAANEFDKRMDDNDLRRGRFDSRAQQAADRMLSIGSQIDRSINGFGRNSGLQYQWQAIRSDLSIVASAYGYNNNRGRGGRFPF